MSNFKVSVILPVINETFSLEKTIEIIIKNSKEDISEIIIIVSKNKTTQNSLKLIKNLEKNQYPNLIKTYFQDLPFLGGAIQKGFQISKGTHIVMMASDLETDPNDVKNLIKLSKLHPSSIITANRWIKGGSFKKYNFIKFYLNFLFQFLLRCIFLTKLSDMTYGYRIFPSKLVKEIKWQELKHPFLLETILKPLLMKINVIEIPSKWVARSEGSSQNTFIGNFRYIKTALMVKFFWKKK
tara:strand:- start:4089 stop:4808 length:720 start_codon:yes stop_codon:yes gene_type:complete